MRQPGVSNLVAADAPSEQLPLTATFNLTDPYPYQQALRAAEVEIVITAKGGFRGQVTRIDIGRLWMQRGRENLPNLFTLRLNPTRAAIMFLADTSQPALRHSGVDVSPDQIMVYSHNVIERRTFAPCHWASMSLPPKDLAAVGLAIAGRELTVPSATYVLRPTPALMSRLLTLHTEANNLARMAPSVLAHPEVAKALEQYLIHAMITCLAEGAPERVSIALNHHLKVIGKLEEFFAANPDRSLYVAEICAATGTSERALRACCHEQLGMGPMRYLWLRRMHLARNALLSSSEARTTVTTIAMDHGFWQLGRFAVQYHALFGELPSATLHRPPIDPIPHPYRQYPLALPTAEFE